MKTHPRSGQSILEILFAVAVGTVLVIAGIGLIVPALRTGNGVNNVQVSAAIGQGLVDNVKAWSEADWHNVLGLATGTTNAYSLNTAQSPFVSVPGFEAVKISSTTLYRYFYVSDVYRTSSGAATTTVSGSTYDPSTKLVTVVVAPSNTSSAALSFATSSWTSTTPVPVAMNNDHTFQNSWSNLVTTNGYLYVIGGKPGTGITPTTTIYYAKATPSGQVGAWAKTTSLPAPFDAAVNAAGYNGYVYVLGSGLPGTATSSVYFAKANSDGGLGAWTLTTPLTGIMNGGTIFAANGYLYYVGGFNNNNTLYAPINANGTLGSWTTGVPATDPTNARVWSPGVYYNGYFYIVGGHLSSTGTSTNTVYYSSASTGGALAAWKQTTSMPVPLNGTPVAIGGRMYILAGDAQGKTVYSAAINTDGTLGTWTQGANLPNPGNGYDLFDFVLVGNSIFSIVPFTTTVQSVLAPLPSGGTPYTFFVTRNNNEGFLQSDWSGGPGDTGPLTAPGNDFNQASTSIIYTNAGSIALAGGAVGTTAFVQGASSAATSSISATLGSAIAGTNHMLVVGVAYWGSVHIEASGPPTDTLGNVFTSVKSFTSPAGVTVALYVAAKVNGGQDTVTFKTSSANETEISMIVAEFSGADEKVVPAAATAGGSGTSAKTNSGNFSLASGNLAIGVMSHDNTETSTVANGYTLIADATDSANFVQPLSMAFKIAASTANSSSSFTLAKSDGWADIAASLTTGHGPFVLVQSTSTTIGTLGNNTNVTQVSKAFPGSVGPADLLVAMIATTNGQPATTTAPVTDSLGNAFFPAGSLESTSDGFDNSMMYYGFNTSGLTASDTVTYKNSAFSALTITIGDFANVGGIDKFDIENDTGAPSTAAVTNIMAPSQSGEVLIGGGTWSNQQNFVFTGGSMSAVASPQIDAEASAPLIMEYQFLTGNPQAQAEYDMSLPSAWTAHGTLFTARNTLTASPGTLESATFDTGVGSGAQLNSVRWEGTQPASTTVKFQFAVSNSPGGPWNYKGPDGTANTYYSPNRHVTMPLTPYSQFSNSEYYRYEVTLMPDSLLTTGPTVNDIVVNWSP